MLTVFNVGQGDSCLLESDFGCIFNREPLLIDCGVGKQKVHTKFSNPKINLMLTHSHIDHIGGLSNILKYKDIGRIYIPYYLPEIIRIAKFLDKHSGFTKLGRIDWGKIANIRWDDTVDQQADFRGDGLYFVKEGDEICAHATILNPPISPRLLVPNYDDGNVDIERALSGLRQMGIELPEAEILNYTPPEILSSIPSNINAEYSGLARRYVHNFFTSLYTRLNITKTEVLSYEIAAHLELAANQASIVMRYEDNDRQIWLFTGDADQSVFERINKQDSSLLKADYLKVPHHGSRENLTKEILNIINPTVAVISHGNRRFGRSKDTHPHYEIIDMLNLRPSTNTCYTNDVIKDKKIIIPATSGTIYLGTSDKKIDFI